MTKGKVLVTGPGGFIGRRVTRLLVDAGHDVHAVSRTRPAHIPPGLTWHLADLLNPAHSRAAMAKLQPQALVHLAWTATPGRFWTDLANLDWVAASLALVRAFAVHGGRRAVFAGTCAEYDWGHALLDEALTPLRPATLYGTAKNALREMLDKAAAPLGLSLAWGRVFFLYGPDEAPGRLVSDIITGIARGQPVLCTAGTQRRDFMHVDDAAAALVTLLGSSYEGAANIASGTSVALRELIMLLAERLGREDLIRLGARPMQPSDPPELRANTRILKEEIGFSPRYNLPEGIAALCDALVPAVGLQSSTP